MKTAEIPREETTGRWRQRRRDWRDAPPSPNPPRIDEKHQKLRAETQARNRVSLRAYRGNQPC